MLDDDCRERKATVTRMSRIALCHGCAREVTLCDHMAPVRDNHVEETRLLTRRRYLASSLEDLLPAAYSGFTISLLLTSAVSSLNITGIVSTNFHDKYEHATSTLRLLDQGRSLLAVILIEY